MDQIVEYSQEIVDRFIKSMGYDPRHIDNNKRMAFTKTNRFKQFAQRFGEETEVVVDEQANDSPTMKNRPYTKGLAQSRAHTKDMALKRSVHVNKPQMPVKTEALEFPGDDGIKPDGSSSRVAGEACGCKHSKKEMSKTAKVVKEMFKSVREELYDKEKDDKEPATYGKKPKFDKTEEDEIGDNKSQARAVLSGGTTLTGQKRDVVEFDPAMKRSKPGALNADVGGNKQ